MTCPAFGALPDGSAVRFRVPVGPEGPSGSFRTVELVLESGAGAGTYSMTEAAAGVYETIVPGAEAGDRYRYRLNAGDLRPDPASRFQPEGVHGPSEIVDPAGYTWSDDGWRGLSPRELVVYELHVGTFTREGTFDAARRRLPLLRALGVTAVELMPIADFAGSRNWGYDGVALFAPSRAYGRPDDLRRLVDDAHALGLGVLLDVVYNHLGPEGAYLMEFLPSYVTSRRQTPWGDAINLDDCGCAVVRGFIVDNAAHWVREYHLDGLRLDATHALIDDSPTHIVADIAAAVRGAVPWPVVVHAEDHRNLASIVEPRERGGWELDGVWADDFHHIVRRLVAGDAHGYYADFEGTTEELARTIRQGWLYTGQPTKRTGEPRGTSASGVPMRASIVCLQNHDQVGNRAVGDRLHHGLEPARWRAASTVLLTAPMTPLLFMGQEWAASTPFQFFTDFEPELGRAVTEGRRREFRDFPQFHAGTQVPDPQAESTFDASRLRWEERDDEPHAASLALYTALLALRAAHPELQASACGAGDAWVGGDDGLVMRRSCGGQAFVIAAALRDGGRVDLGPDVPDGRTFAVVLTTEDAPFASDPQPPAIDATGVTFRRAGAVVLRAHPAR